MATVASAVLFRSESKGSGFQANERPFITLQSVSWILAEFRHNKIVPLPRENCFNVCRQLQRKVRSRKHDV